MKYLFSLLMMLLVLTGCSAEVVEQITTIDGVTTLQQTDQTELIYSDDFIAVTIPVTQTAFYDTQTQVYSLEDNQLVTSENYKEKNMVVGLYENGLYTISLTSNKVTLYTTDGTKTSHTINSLFQKENWTMATLSPDASTLIYVENGEMKQYDIASKVVTIISGYQPDWEVLEWKDNCLYLKSSSSILTIKEGAVSEILDVGNYTYFSSDYSIASPLEGTFEVYNMTTMETKSIYSNIGETVVKANPRGIFTQLSSDYYYYDLEEMLKYTLNIEDVQEIHFKEDGNIILIKNNGTIEKLTLEEATKVNVVRTTTSVTLRGKYVIDAPIMAQLPNYPTGCETISTMMLLEYLGKGIDTDTFIDEYLDTTAIQYSGGTMYAPNPNDSFVGNPRSEAAYGCMVPVIEKALISYLGSDKYVENTTGFSLDELCEHYINRDMPVLVWASINMLNIYPTSTWITPDGSTYQWLANEHCLLLVGYDDYYYYFNDPWTGRLSAYSRSVVQQRYMTLGYQSLTVISH